MKKISKIFAVAALFIASSTFSANAQFYHGVKAGINSVSLSIKNSSGELKSESGFQAGVFIGTDITNNGVNLEAEALWINNKFEAGPFGQINSNSIEIPVMAAIQVLPLIPLQVKVGPSFMVYNKATALDGKIELNPIKSTIGYVVGVGLDIMRITLDVRFNGQFLSKTPFKGIGSNIVNKPSAYDFRTNSVSASIGYKF